jgi:hypothetical protein
LRVSDEGRQYGNQGNAIAATVKRRAASALVCRRHAWLERKLKVNKALARHERPAQADQAPPVRRTSGAPSLRGGVGEADPWRYKATNFFTSHSFVSRRDVK